MAQTALIQRKFAFGKNDAGEEEFAVFDSVISEGHSFEIAIPDDPVETGVSLTDHAYAKPRSLQMEVAVSDTPLLYDGKDTPVVQLATTWTDGGHTRRSVLAWDYILDKAMKFAIFDVQTGLEFYPNMMFEVGSATTTRDTAGCLRASLKLKQVRFASSRMVEYPPRGPKKTKRTAAPKTDDGNKQAEEVKKPTRSLLKGLPGPWNNWGAQ
jgi:hypothetical protein